jgi:polyisoprenoid-binding protein YceI
MTISEVKGLFQKFRGHFDFDVSTGILNTISLEISAPSIYTNDSKRDKHLRSRDFFEVSKYPVITFKSTKISPVGKKQFDVLGILTIRNRSREQKVKLTYLGAEKKSWKKESIYFSAEADIDRILYGVKWNKLLEGDTWLLGKTIRLKAHVRGK